MADIVNGVKVYSDEMEVLDYINDNFPAELKSRALKQMSEAVGQEVLLPFHLMDSNKKYYALLIKLAEADDGGSLILLVAKESQSILKYIDETVTNAPEEYKSSLQLNRDTTKRLFEEIDKHLNNANQ